MNPLPKLLIFAVVLLFVFGGGWALGHAFGPAVDDPPVSSTTTTVAADHSTHGGD